MTITMIRSNGNKTIRPEAAADYAALKLAGAFAADTTSIRREADWAEFARRSGLPMVLKVTSGIQLRIN